MTQPVKRGGQWIRVLFCLVLGAVLLATVATPASPEERTVIGTVVERDVAERTFSIRDGKGVVWNYKIDEDAGIALDEIRVGDRVSVTIGRPTPLNMITSADRLRIGDRVTKIPF